jgi:hypothetical protein
MARKEEHFIAFRREHRDIQVLSELEVLKPQL